MSSTSAHSKQSSENEAPRRLMSLPSSLKLAWKPWTSRIRWFNLAVVATTPSLALYGAFTTKLHRYTLILCVLSYLLNMIGITAGCYHRLWSHRSYNASIWLQYFLALAGAGAIQGSIRWWARGHRAHHRYTDTDLDPYGAHHGLFWTHIGWMLIKSEIKPGEADVRDLRKNTVVTWQHEWYFTLAFLCGIAFPWITAGYLWNDWRVFLTISTLFITRDLQSVFSVNSIAHWLGETTFDDRHTPRDHFITAILTLGEGYHNFHHQFPMDYRNAVKWYQYDPTKWFIALCSYFGLAAHLQVFPENEIRMAELTMSLKRLKNVQDDLVWPTTSDDLPVINWDSYQVQSRSRPLILVSGFIHDVSELLDNHPGGRELLTKAIGTDATSSFFGGVYEHSHSAHNLLAKMRVGALHGGLEHIDQNAIPPAQKLRITEQFAAARPPPHEAE